MINTPSFIKSYQAWRKQRSSRPNAGNLKAKFQLFARGLLGPITLLAVAGIFLGIGAVIRSYSDIPYAGYIIGNILNQIGNVVFTLLPLLFGIAIAAAFTENSGTAVMTSVIVYVALLAISGAFFVRIPTSDAAPNGGWSWLGAIDFITTDTSSSASSGNASPIVTVLGFQTLQLSVFGGFIAGPIAVFAFRRFKDQRMPAFLAMFQGLRFVPIMGLILAIPMAFLLSLIWPWIAYGFIRFGQVTGQIGFGGDSFLFGWLERSLLPTGLHAMFYSPLLYSAAGATVDPAYQIASAVSIGGTEFVAGTALYGLDATPFFSDVTIISGLDSLPDVAGIQISDANWASVSSEATTLFGDRTSFQELVGSEIQYAWVDNLQNGVSVTLGRFSAGKVPLMMFWIPAAGAAMIMAAPKSNRKIVIGVVGAAALTSFLTGITEPFEYTFLFVAPALFWGFHAIMAGFGYMFANVAGVYYGPTFGGVIDLIIFGIIPQATGQATNFWWLLVIGVAGMPLYYAVFYYAIKFFDLKTPGRDGKDSIKLMRKADYKALKEQPANGVKIEQSNSNKVEPIAQTKVPHSSKKVDPLEEKAHIMFKALGGNENIEILTNCASRLRVTVKDPEKVDYEFAQESQPFGIVGKGKKAQQYIYGPNVIIIAEKVREIMENKVKPKY